MLESQFFRNLKKIEVEEDTTLLRVSSGTFLLSLFLKWLVNNHLPYFWVSQSFFGRQNIATSDKIEDRSPNVYLESGLFKSM